MFEFLKAAKVVAPKEDREAAAQLLMEVADGKLPSAEALKRFSSIAELSLEKDKVMSDSWHELCHFDSDSDIRERDEGYALAQIEGLRIWAERLRSDKR